MNRQTKILLLAGVAALVSALASRVQAQAAVQAWAQLYSAPAYNNYTDQKLVVDSSGNVIVAGNGTDESGGDWLVIKYSGAGAALWTNRYAGPGKSAANALAVDGSGNVFVTGASTVKYSGSGVTLWTMQRGGTALAVDGSGNVVLTGSSSDGTHFGYETIKCSSAGMALWTNRYGGPGSDFDEAVAVAVDTGGKVFVTGYSEFDGGTTDDFATVAYSSAGVPLWTNRFNGPGSGYSTPNALAVDGNGNVFVAGYSDDPDGIDSDFATIAYSAAGVPLWTNLYHGTGATYSGAVAVAVDGSNNVFVTGSTSNGTNQDYTTIKYSSAGMPLWTNRYVGPGDTYDTATAAAVDASGSVFVTGFSEDTEENVNFATVAYSSAGLPLWTNLSAGDKYNPTAAAVAVNGSGNVFVTGSSAGSFVTINYSGAGASMWTNGYNDLLGNSIDQASAVIVDGGGSVFVTGSSIGIGSASDFATIKYSSAGVPLWTNRYNGPGNGYDVPFVMAADSAGNVIVAGYSWSGTNYDCLTIKYSGAGASLWTNRYNGPGNADDYADALGVDTNDNVFVSASSIGSGGHYDYATIKYSSAGVPLWTNRYHGPANGDDYANALAVDASGSVFVTGSSTANTNGDSDYATIKYSGAGVPLWTNRYNGPANGDDQAIAAAVDSSGSVIVTGRSVGSSDTYDYDYATIKYSSAGALLWTRRYAGPYFIDTASTLAVDASNNVIVTGDSLDPSGSFAFTTIKYSSAGVVLWTARYSDPAIGDGIVSSMAVDTGGNVFISGSSYGPDSALDYATIAYSSAGVLLWTNHYNGPGNRNDVTGVIIRNTIVNPLKTRQALALGHDGSVYVTGTSEISIHGTASDFATVKYVVPPNLARSAVTNGHFAFTVSGSSGASVEIQASTDLQSWLPLVTNTLVGGTNYFSDPQSANANARFYRALLLP